MHFQFVCNIQYYIYKFHIAEILKFSRFSNLDWFLN